MKYPHINHSARIGFSLVEILVVIAILSLLAASAFVAASKITKNSKLEQNRSLATVLERGIEDFYSEYGYYPIQITNDTILTSAQQTSLLNALAGNDRSRNTKGKNFIESFDSADNGRNGLIYSGNNIDSLVDSFGGNFSIMLDGNYDEVITEPSDLGFDEAMGDIKGKSSLIWCYGEEVANTEDIITTWR